MDPRRYERAPPPQAVKDEGDMRGGGPSFPRFDYQLPPTRHIGSSPVSRQLGSQSLSPRQSTSTRHMEEDIEDYDREEEATSIRNDPSHKRSAESASHAGEGSLHRDHDRGQPKPRLSSGTTKGSIKKDPSAGHGEDEAGTRRAAQACLRCRKQKLKCIGGWPCNRCTKSKNVCDFGRPGMGAPPKEGATIEANARLEQLESSVANLLAGLAGGTSYPTGELLHTFDPTQRRANGFQAEPQATSHASHPPWAPHIPPPTHTRPIDPPRMGSHSTGIPSGTIAPSPDDPAVHNHVRFTSSPNIALIPQQSPSAFSSAGTGPSPASAAMVGSGPPGDLLNQPRRRSKGQKAAERLATATEGDFDEAPFKALVYQPAVWDNREQSRRNSPQPSQPQSRDEPLPGTYDRRMMRDKDDPVNTELVDSHMAETLFGFFIDHCHPFLPIVNVALDDAFNTIRQSPFLISAMLAVAARFYIKFSSRSPGAMPALDPNLPARLANLAEAHLGNTLLRKQHALSDVQAVLLMSAWGLQSGGRGPDAWVVTGHAARIARRLGVHKVLAQAAEVARMTRPGTPEWDKLEAFMPQWRTWLCWFSFDGFLSLGFGRPQSTQFETVDEQGFLQIRLNQSLPRPGSTPSISLYGDVYIAGQVQLTQIGRDLINWGEMLSGRTAVLADPRRAEMFRDKELTVRSMFRDLNERLDDWSKLWVWSGSPYTLYLGSSARIARLQADHMRLCLNSFALKSAPEEDELVAQCLKKALNAAMSTIQTHYESSQTDMALSFATDYLTITLAQSAVFLVRIAKAPPAVQRITSIDPSVIAHYLKMSIDLLEAGELSETKLSTYLAKTIRDIARAAEIGGFGRTESEDSGDSRPPSAHASMPPQPDVASNAPDLTGFEIDSFMGFENQLDLNYLLGLPGDNSLLLAPSTNGQASNGDTTPLLSGAGGFANSNTNGVLGLTASTPDFNEFSFGMGGMGGYVLNMGGSGWGFTAQEDEA